MSTNKATKLAKTAKFYGNIEKAEKQDDGTMIVMGYASSESVDSDGEIIKADAIKAAIPAYMKFANVREMHKSDSAVGTVLEMETQEDGRTWVKTHIVDEAACKKVEHKVFKGFSIGGRVTERDQKEKHIIKGITLSEISLVDRPANPEAVFTFAKAEGAVLTDEEIAAIESNTKAETNEETIDGGNADTLEGGKVDEIIADGDKDATSEKDAADKPEIKKGMCHVASLAYLLKQVQYLTSDQMDEMEREGDGSAVPAALVDWLKQGGEILKAMTTEEVAELTANYDNDSMPDVDVFYLGERATTLIKAAWSKDDAEAFTKAWAKLIAPHTDDVAKAGATHSKATIERIGKMKDLANDIVRHADALVNKTAEESADKDASATVDDLTKSAKTADEIVKMLGDVDGETAIEKVEALVKIANAATEAATKSQARVAELEALPAPLKATLRVVEKNSDAASLNSQTADNEPTKIDSPDAAKESLKKVWARGGQPL
jgi:phage head maturation protease